MMKEKRTNNGNCYLCGKTLGKTALKNHILKEHDHGEEESFLLRVDSAVFKDYWLYIDMPKSKKIEYIDKFLRKIWLECCGHMSQFHRAGKARKIGDFAEGTELHYEYDMGTTTELSITFICKINRPKQIPAVRLLARNEPPNLNCSVCGEPAKFICSECMYNPDEAVGSLFCEKHAKKHEHDDMIMPITNSPRSGECGYDGENDFYTFTGNLEHDKRTSVGNIRKYHWVYVGEDK